MKAITFLKSTLCGSLFLLIPFIGWSQSNPFDVKKHAPVILDKSELQANHVKGGFLHKSAPARQQYAGRKNSVASSIKPQGDPVTVVTSKESGLPIFITTPVSSSSQRTEATTGDARARCMDYLSSISNITKVQKPEEVFEVSRVDKDVLGKTHVKLVQKYKGIKIHDAEVVVHFNPSMAAEIFNGNYHLLSNDIDVTPSISAEQALSTVIANLSSKTLYKELSSAEKEVVEHSEPLVDVVIYEDKSLVKSYLLVYHISICPNVLENWEYFVNAKTGVIVKSSKHTCHANGPQTATALDLNNVSRTINTFLLGADYMLLDASKPMYNGAAQKGAIITMDANNTFGVDYEIKQITSTDNIWSDKKAVSAHHNASTAYDFYRAHYGRNSIDGDGGNIYSVINVADFDGSSMDNAYWSGKMMYYGNGGTYFNRPLAAAMDVAGHEMTHGVVQYSANLKYEGESGAINESMADIFGFMMDSTDWMIGEDVANGSEFPTGAIRSFSDPHNGGSSFTDVYYQPRHVSEKYTGTLDEGGVHINSGIPNYAFYKYALSLGSKLKASQIFYRALTVYLISRSQFIDLRLAVIQAAKDLYGNSSSEAVKAGLAFDAVGIVDGPGTVVPPTLPPNQGTEYMLYYNINPANTNGIYRSSPIGFNATALAGKIAHKKPSITDDGEMCVFVGTDKKIYSINVNPSKPTNLTVINNQTIWSNVAISKDGNRLAATTDDTDNKIYVYDFVQAEWTSFELYNPEGTPDDVPVYADALEWSYDGESVLYDCLNRITDNWGDDVEYWDIGLIKVWDKTAHDFSTGDVTKVLKDREEGEDAGNPTFSKNSPHIIAFDYTNSTFNMTAIAAYDMAFEDVGLIVYNNTIGYPSYNKNDNKLAFVILNDNGDSEINSVGLYSDKISSDETKVKLILKSTWPVYFAVGQRATSTGIGEGAEDNSSKVQVYPNPTKDKVSFVLPASTVSSLEVGVFNQMGQLVYSETSQPVDHVITVDMDELPNGMYYVSLTGDSFNSSHKVVKQK